jgi:alpha-amylase
MDQHHRALPPAEKRGQLPSRREAGIPLNGQLRLYNQFPRCYQNIDQMTLQLPQIAIMGFNAVWINPIQLTGTVEIEKHIGRTEEKTKVKKSLYAMTRTDVIDDAFSVAKNNFPYNPENIYALQQYTRTAHHWGLTPLFDLVLNHMAADSPLVANPRTKNWFKPISAFDDDVIDFDYKNHGKEIV